VQTVEQTSKKYKGQQLVAALLTMGSCGAVFVQDEPSSGPVLGILVGLCWFLGARIFAWWDHG
jgi:hypothetical protein